MDLVPVRTHIRLSNIELDTVPPPLAPSPPSSRLYGGAYLWTAFFKVDGDTVFVGNNLNLQGRATVVGTQGDHGDLPGNGGLSNTSIPSQIGEFRTVLTPIPVRPIPGKTLPGVVGCIAIILSPDDTPAHAVAQGHQTLNSSLQNELDTEILTLGFNKQTITDADVQAMKDRIENAVHNAVANSLSGWDKFLTLFGFKTQDSVIGTAIYRFSTDDLTASAPQGISLQNGYPNPTTIETEVTNPVAGVPNPFTGILTWTFHGTIIADPLPISLRRVLVGLGYQQPLPGVREAMGTFPSQSLSAWIAAVR